jgi:NhaP-type Na+/H+ or K+/H+ antiporter
MVNLLILVFIVGFIIVDILYYFVTETVKYYVRNNGIDEAIRNAPSTIIVCALITLVVGTLFIYFYRKVDVEKNKKLLRFAFVILIAALGYFIATVIKSPIGRMRYRAMNMINDVDYFI